MLTKETVRNSTEITNDELKNEICSLIDQLELLHKKQSEIQKSDEDKLKRIDEINSRIKEIDELCHVATASQIGELSQELTALVQERNKITITR